MIVPDSSISASIKRSTSTPPIMYSPLLMRSGNATSSCTPPTLVPSPPTSPNSCTTPNPRSLNPGSVRELVLLESVGILARIEAEPEETWELPPPIRRSILRLPTGAGGSVRQQLSSLAHHQLGKNRPVEALDYAVEAQNWALTARIIDRHWAAMLTVDAHTLQTSLGNIPPEAASQYPAVLAGRVMLGTNPAVDNDRYPPLPQSPREVSALGRHRHSERCAGHRLRPIDHAPERRRVRQNRWH